MFKNYHYLSFDLNPACQIFVAKLWGKTVGFCAVIHFPHPRVKNMKKISRIVVLPDYQGIGIGKALMNFVGEYYTERDFRLTITTSHPSINKSLREPWRLIRQNRVALVGKTSRLSGLSQTNTRGRITCSWEYMRQ